MASQRITIAKIVGEAAVAVFDRFCCYSHHPDQKTLATVSRHDSCNRKLATFVSALRSHSHCPPVVFYSEFIDMWSMGDVLVRPFVRCREQRFLHVDGGIELMLYRLPDKGRLERRLQAALRSRRAICQEERLYLTILLESTVAWESMTGDATIIVIRDVYGPSLADDEIEEAMKCIPDWIGTS